MPDLGDHPENKIAEQARRTKTSWPILLLAALFLVATFLAWYFTWFGRGLSDADITKYLSDTKNPRHVQHALLQIQQRIERKDPSAKTWYPQIEALSSNSETEFRLTTAWLMGFDNQSPGFHDALLRLVRDEQPLVRRNAALALVRFNDSTGRQELVSVLKPYPVKSNANGIISSTLKQGSEVSRGTLLARVQESGGKSAEVRAPLPGRVIELVRVSGSQVNSEDVVVMLNSDEDSVWEALRGLALIGTSEDLNVIQSLINSNDTAERVKEQAKRSASMIGSRHGK